MRATWMAALWVLSGGAALADFTVCNESGVSRSLAIGYVKDETWISEGWWGIETGECETLIAGPLAARYIYWRATAPGESFPDEGYVFCTSPEAFTITGAEDCGARGLDSAGFRRADTGETDPDYTLILRPELIAPFLGPVPASGPGFEPGQLGEPFAQSALLQGCGPAEGGEACVLMAEGWRYILRRGGPSPSEIFTTLADLPINSPVLITGEIVSQGDVSAEVHLSQIAPGPPDPHAKDRAALQGTWVSTLDPLARMRIEGSEVEDLYGEESLALQFMTLDPVCLAEGGAEGEGLVLNLADPSRGEEGLTCLGLVSVTPDVLELIHLPGGNLLSYRRE